MVIIGFICIIYTMYELKRIIISVHSKADEFEYNPVHQTYIPELYKKTDNEGNQC